MRNPFHERRKEPPPPPPPKSSSFFEFSAAILVASASLPLVLFLALFLLDLLLFRPLRSPKKRSKSLGNARFSMDKGPTDLDAIVIGSGQAGLSCASVLSQFGAKVVVLEQHEVTGGGAHCFAVDGKSKWRFDAGHHITIPWHEQVLHLACGTAQTPVPFDKTAARTADNFSDRIALGQAPDGEAALPIRNDSQLTAELIKRFPAHKQAILDYMSLADAVQMRCEASIAAHDAALPTLPTLLSTYPPSSPPARLLSAHPPSVAAQLASSPRLPFSQWRGASPCSPLPSSPSGGSGRA